MCCQLLWHVRCTVACSLSAFANRAEMQNLRHRVHAGAPPRSPSSWSRSSTPRGPSALQQGLGYGPYGAGARAPSALAQGSAGAELATAVSNPNPAAAAVPVPRRSVHRGWGGGGSGPGVGSAGLQGSGSAPLGGRTPPSVAGSPALSSLDRCAAYTLTHAVPIGLVKGGSGHAYHNLVSSDHHNMSQKFSVSRTLLLARMRA